MMGPRRWTRRAVLSALAGSGLTAAGIGGPLAAAALGAEAPTATSGNTENPTPPAAETSPKGAALAGAAQPSSTTSSTAPAAPAPAGASTTSIPSAAAPTPDPAGAGTAAPTVVVQRKQKTTRGGRRARSVSGTRSEQGPGAQGQVGAAGAPGAAGTPGSVGAPGTPGATNTQSGPGAVPAGTPNGVAPAPQTVGGEAGTLTSLLAGSAVSAQALDFYRIPLFLLPIYQAAAVEYDVPWQILAAINEVETDYGTDLSVSTAGAVGWMQFMPQTWTRYGVDATAAGYADPYNPVDAIFAAARYLHAAGASHNLHAAILAYNHSDAYVESVLLRARLDSGYPNSVIAALTGLVEARLPIVGAHLAPGAVYLPGASSAGSTPAGAASPTLPASSSTAGAVPASTVPASPLASADAALHRTAAGAPAGGDAANAGHHTSTAVPGSTPAPPPRVAAARAEAAANAPASASQLVDLAGKPGAPVVAVQDGRVEHLGHSHKLGRYLVLRDVYGDVFTYAGLGSIVPRYRPAAQAGPLDLARQDRESAAAAQRHAGGSAVPRSGVLSGEAASDPAPTQPASAGHQPPLTLKVRARAARRAAAAAEDPIEAGGETAPASMGKVRLYAHPGNPVARAAAARAAKSTSLSGHWQPLRAGSLVTQGTILGHLTPMTGAGAGELRFAVRPAGDSSTVDPAPLLANWRQLGVALHPKGSKGERGLLGATADDVFPMSKGELERAVLSDPGIQLDACGRRDVAAGALDRRVLAVLEFLSRSGLQPTVSALQCPAHRDAVAGLAAAHFAGNAVDISAINGIPIAGHQGRGTITDTTIRTLLALRGKFVPHRIVSLMKYPEAPNTLAQSSGWDHIHIAFAPATAAGAHTARAATTGGGIPSVQAAGGSLSPLQWNQLVSRIAAIPQPTIAAKPSSAAIRDPQAPAAELGLGGAPTG
jgi:transglycosylase-like protein with SLT domain